MFHSVFCLGTSVFPGLEQGLAGPPLCFCNKVLLEHSHAILLHSVYGHVYAGNGRVAYLQQRQNGL